MGRGFLRALLAALVLAAMSGGGWWLYHAPALSIRDVEVGGANALSDEVVRSVADLGRQSVLRPDFGGARQRLLALPLVKEARISRAWPTNARITIVERTPAALWQVGDRRYVIDDDGVVLDQPPPEGAPLIVQMDTAPSLAPGDRVDAGAVAVAERLTLTAQQTLARSVAALQFSQASGLTAVLSGRTSDEYLWVTFGDAQGYEFKLAALYAVLRRAEEEGRTLRRVDLRFGDRVAVQ